MNAAARLQLVASPPLTVREALDRFHARVAQQVARVPAQAAQDRLRRRVVLHILRDTAGHAEIDTIEGFESTLNACLDAGYREGPLTAFVFEVLERRLAARVRRRLLRSGQDARPEDVADLVSTSFEAIQRLLRQADRVQHTVRYNLLLSIGDHRAIDHLRRRRPIYLDTLDEQAADDDDDGWALATAARDPERWMVRLQRLALARSLRAAVFDAVNELPDRERAALVMVEALGCSYDDVAARVGVKRTDVGNVVRRARLARDRALVPRLRTIAGLEGHIGFGALQDQRALRLKMVRWSTEMGAGVCPHCLDGAHRLHALADDGVTDAPHLCAAAGAVGAAAG